MLNQNLELPRLKHYAAFIQNNFLDQFIQEVLSNYKTLEIPLLKFFGHLTVQELQDISKNSIYKLLREFSEGKAVDAAQTGINNWKSNNVPGLSRDNIKASDIILINNARKSALFKLLPLYISNVSEVYPLLKEIEDYYTHVTEITLQAFAEIMEEEITQREKRLKEVQAIGQVGNWEYDTVSENIKWSEELYRIYQIPSSTDLKLEDIVQYIIPEDFIHMQKAVRKAALNLGSYQVEYKIKTSGGEIKTLQENGYAELDKENKLIYHGTTQDITHLKKIESKLIENETNYRLLTENSTDIISRHSLDSTILYITPSCIPITGYLPEELIGKKAYDFYHPEDLASMEEKYKIVVDVPESSTVSFRFRKKNGSYVWFESIGKTLKDVAGKPYEIIATNRDITERKLTEFQLKSNEELLSGVLNSAISGIQVFKSIRNEQHEIIDFEWILANDSILKLFGFKREKLIGNTLLTVFPGVIQDNLLEVYIRAAEGITSSFRHFYQWEGLNNWFNIIAMKYGDGFILSTDDITAQIHAEEELKQSNIALEEKVKKRTAQLEQQKEDIYSVLMQAPAMIAIMRGDDYIFELANPLYLKVVGKHTNIIGKPLLDIFPEIEDQEIYKIIQNLYATGERYVGNEVLMQLDINNDGLVEDIYFNFVYEPLRNREGKIDGFLTHAVEVTAQVQSRLQLEESEVRFRTMADNIPNLAWMANADGYIFWFNKRWYDYTGTNFEQMKGWGWESVHDPKELVKTKADWMNAIESGDSIEMVFTIKGADNAFRPFLCKVAPVQDAVGKIVRWFGTNTDISLQIKAEENLERKNKELLKINNDLDNFIYTASHDLKSPVSNLEGLLNMVSDESAGLITEVGRDVLPMVSQSLLRLKNVIQELTEIAKIQKDIEISDEEIFLEDFYQEIILSCTSERKLFNGEIRSDFSEAPVIRFSKKNLRSIFFNLISNAFKYSDSHKQGLIEVYTKKSDQYIILVVKDNGLGIPTNQLEKVFIMFKRFHTHVEGSGVGLYIIKRIIENAGGKITIESKEGAGTTFQIYFKC